MENTGKSFWEYRLGYKVQPLAAYGSMKAWGVKENDKKKELNTLWTNLI